jgi:hypothetical protein
MKTFFLPRMLRSLAASAGGTRGSILIETLVVLPLYLALMGGGLWTGELMWNRLDLTAQERLAAWSPRWRTPVPKEARVKVETVGDWYYRTEGWSERKVRMPDWVRGMLDLKSIVFGGDRVRTQETVPGRGRDLRHEMYVRQPDLDPLRTAPGRKLGPGDWYGLYYVRWTHAEITGDLARPVSVGPYKRDSNYVELSK